MFLKQPLTSSTMYNDKWYIWMLCVCYFQSSYGLKGTVSIWSIFQAFFRALWERSCKLFAWSLSHSEKTNPEVRGISKPRCFIMRATASLSEAFVQNLLSSDAFCAAKRTHLNALLVFKARRLPVVTIFPVLDNHSPPSSCTKPSYMAFANTWILWWRPMPRAQKLSWGLGYYIYCAGLLHADIKKFVCKKHWTWKGWKLRVIPTGPIRRPQRKNKTTNAQK